MHILFLPISYPHTYNSTSGIFFREQANALSDSCKVSVIALVGVSIITLVKTFKLRLGLFRSNNKITVLLFQYLSLPKLSCLNNFIKLQIGKKLFKKYIKEHGLPDLVHVQVFLAGGLALWIKKKYGIPYIVSEHYSSFIGTNKLTWYDKRVLTKVYSNSSANISVSQTLQKALYYNFNIKSIVIHNTVDTDFFSQVNKKTTNRNFIFLNVANLNYNKNHISLINAFNRIIKINPFCKLIIAGGGGEKRRLNTLVNQLGLSQSICLLGQITKEEVRSLMCISDCFILTSYRETFGVVLIEAMSVGLPVISTKSGGPEDIVIDDKTGLLCDLNIDSIADAMKKVMSQKYNANYISAETRKRFSYYNFKKQVMSIYKEVINARTL